MARLLKRILFERSPYALFSLYTYTVYTLFFHTLAPSRDKYAPVVVGVTKTIRSTLNKGVLYRYVPDADSAEAQLVIPTAERELIMERHHNDPMAGHYGEEGTFQKITRRYYWTGMRKYISDYIKKCPECARFKATNQKPAGLLRTPVYSQRFEVIAIDLFGPLPQTDTGKQWIFIVENCATKWVELFALSQASARQCATTLIEEVFMRHGIPRRIISDNGTQFVSAVLQQICFNLNISQNLIPVYSPQSNPVERKNRDLKPRLAILVRDDHSSWYSKLPVIRFAMNTTVCDTTGHTPAYLLFGRELRTVDDVVQDFKSVVHNDNFVAEITPYLKRFSTITEDIRERIETKQDQRKSNMIKIAVQSIILLEINSTSEKRPTTKSYIHITKINMFQARRLLQQQFPTEPSIPQQELLLQQLIMSPRRDVVGSIGGDCNPVV
ncbi:hypothetical protein TNCV_1380141 [Trichonephila clavipes]|nr:hypothetical protein TNCV_1380141 [Trichonephila clavipes]